ncbi:SPE1 [Candida oxycetoniae]|uniref:Ornithine decarboxylase n=1 Tax=Candida oxycetoniae TaxID=497107 RepID=A0AAI9SX06_9ASCO|nr:SPE1 [Candida oxycetoniae]KAI3404644.1 SPE1 [Candida oxycetoniae]
MTFSIVEEKPISYTDGLSVQNDIIRTDNYTFTVRQNSAYFESSKTVNLPNNSHLVEKALIDHVLAINHEECDAGDEDSFFVCDLNQIRTSVEVWKQLLPRVQPHYAIKCNTNIEVLKYLDKLGVNFDCASKNEIDTVLQLGVDASRIVYANPCKTTSFIRHARNNGVDLTTVDNVQELQKLAKFHPKCRILIRIVTDDEDAQCRLSTKFGCSLRTAMETILPTAKELNLPVVGVAFHVGSGAKNFNSIYKAIRDSRILFDCAIDLGFNMSILDIGGGFEFETFTESSRMVNYSIDKFFPHDYIEQNQIKVIAEPGRFMVANAFTLATHIIAKRELSDGGGIKAMLYINDGVYGNMNCILFDHQEPKACVLQSGNEFHYIEREDVKTKEYDFSIWGPTCDGLDCVSTKARLRYNVDVGDWLYFPNLGAYTSCATTQFNGFKNDTKVIYIPISD